MKTRFVVILVLANAAALAAGFAYAHRYWGRQAAQELQTTQSELAALKARTALRASTAASAPAVVYRTNDFRWSSLESTDYRQYIANLRAVGCPESTIKDIILTDVMRLYAGQLGRYYHNGRPFKYWETNDKRKLTESQIEARDQALARINKELPSVLRELLGINYERELNKYFVDADDDNERLGFLSDDKRTQTLALRDKYEGERERILNKAPNGVPSPEDVELLRQIDQEQDLALSGLLTSDEKEQYEMTTSPAADQLRQQLVGFNPTEAEFQDLFRRQKAIDDQYAYQDANDPTVASAKAAAQAEMMKDFKGGLTGDRAGQLDRSQSPDYQSLCDLTQRFSLPAATSDEMVAMRQAAESEKQELVNNKDIPPGRVEAALVLIQAEMEKAARETLGDQAYSVYSASAPWIKNLGTN